MITHEISNIKFKNQINLNKHNTSVNINITEIEPPDKLIQFNESNQKELEWKKVPNVNNIKNFSTPNNANNGRIGIAFVFKSLYGNGIGRMLSLTCSELSKLEKYDIYMITGDAIPSLDFYFDKRVIMVRIGNNKSLIQKYNETLNIKIYVLQNDLNPSTIKWFRNLNGGKKVIGVTHGVYMSSIFDNLTGVYSIWHYHNLYDAYISVIADDYYFNKRLGINTFKILIFSLINHYPLKLLKRSMKFHYFITFTKIIYF